MTHGTYAIVLTCDREELRDRCLRAIAPQVDSITIINNSSWITKDRIVGDDEFRLIDVTLKPPNLSLFWNLGIDSVALAASRRLRETWDVAFLCDDAIVHPGWFQEVTEPMRALGATAGSTHSAVPVTYPILKTEKDSDIWNGMCPWAFVMQGEAGIRADEDLKWWWGDTHMDFTARGAGGMVIAPGAVVQNEKLGEYTNIYSHLAEQAGRDGETFAAKWGGRPW